MTFILYSCDNKIKEEVPSISENKMVEVLTLLYINEVKATNQFELGVQKNEFFKQYLYPAIFDSLEVNEDEFYKSYDYYDNNPSALQSLMEEVSTVLEAYEVDTTVIEEELESLHEVYEQINNQEKTPKEIRKRKGQ